MVLKQHVGQERSKDVFAVIEPRCAVAALQIFPDDAKQVNSFVAVKDFNEIQRLAIGVLVIVRRKRKRRRP